MRVSQKLGDGRLDCALMWVLVAHVPSPPVPKYNADKAIVDSGTTLLRLPQKVLAAVVEAVAHRLW